MKIYKLNARGFSHELIIVAAVVVVGVAGSAALVLSHADSCTPVSGATSGSADSAPTSDCTPDSGPTSQPTSTVAAASCTIQMLPSTKPTVGTIPKFVVTVANAGNSSVSPAVNTKLVTLSSTNSPTVISTKTLQYGQITPGNTANMEYDSQYTVPLASAAVQKGYFVAHSNKPAFQCRVNFTLPTRG